MADTQHSHQPVARRDFLRAAGLAAASAALPVTVVRCSTQDGEPGTGPAGSTLTLDLTTTAYASLATPGGSVYVSISGRSEQFVVHRVSTTEAAAFSSRCTHQGCTVDLPSGGIASCPCHGARYDSRGHVVTQPSSGSATDLASLPATVSGNTIVLTLG